MMRAIRLLCVLGLAVMPMLAHAAGSSSASPTKNTSAAIRSSKPAAKKSPTKKNPKAKATKAAGSTEMSAARAPGPRKLEDIHIEGEVPVPQVLFITARDQRRFLESHHDLYLRTSKELGQATPLPMRVVLTPTASPVPASTPGSTPVTTPAPTPAPAAAPAKKEGNR